MIGKSALNNSENKSLKTANDVIYYNVGNFIYLGAQWIISVALVRMGGFEDAGYFSLAMSVCNIFAMIANYGLRTFQVSDINGKYTDNTYVITRITTSLIAFVLCFFYVAFFQRRGFISALILLYMIFKCIESYSDVLTSIFQKNDKMIYAGISLGAKGFLNLIVFLVVYTLTSNLVVSVGLMAVSSLMILLCFDFIKIKKYYNQAEIIKKADLKSVWDLLKEGILLMLYVLAVSAFNGIPRMIIEKRESAKDLGVFSSIAIPTVIITVFTIGLLYPVVPKLTSFFNKKEDRKITKTLGVCVLIIVAIGLTASLFSALFGKQAMELLFGKEILQHFNLLYYMIVSSVFIAINGSLSAFLTSIRKLKQELAFSVLACVLVAGLSYLLIGKSGIYGAAYAMIISLAIQFVLETAYVIGVIQKQCKP